jgi:hypothetical protein
VVITADRAEIAGEQAGFPVFGGIALNLPVGGLNPEAVEVALRIRIYIKDMLDPGISESDIRMMVSDNPARILGI